MDQVHGDNGETPSAAALAYDQVLRNFQQLQEQQRQVADKESVVSLAHQCVEVERSLHEAKQINGFVPRYLTKSEEALSYSYYSPEGVTNLNSQPGSIDEAIHYAYNARVRWTNTPDALEWLCSRTEPKMMPPETVSNGSHHVSYASVLGKDELAMREDEYIDESSDPEDDDEESSSSSDDDDDDDETLTEMPLQQRERQPIRGNYRRRKKVVEYFFMAARDDPTFRQMLGEWGDTLPVTIPLADIKGPNFEQEQAKKLEEIAKMDPRIRLSEYCIQNFRTPPTYTAISEDGPPHERRFGSQIIHEGDDRIHGIGYGATKKSSEFEAAKNAVQAFPEFQIETAGVKQILETTFRGAATTLPFAVRFQLERCLFDSKYVILNLKNPRRSRIDSTERERRKTEVSQKGREMLLVFITKLLPPLLHAFRDFDPNDGAMTLSELFADEIYKPIQGAKEAISKGTSVKFDGTVVRKAMERAENALRTAEELCCTTEAELGRQDKDDFDLIKKRSLWPVAEYRCKFNVNGQLVPTGYDVMNRSGSKEPQSRRALREKGWHVRDRFLLYSSVTFDEPHRSHLVDWIAMKPKLCNREYVYLFDKGTGKPHLWFFSPTMQCSRESLLESIGSFGNVAKSKLGDRIGLAFTQTVPIAKLDVDQIEPISEIVANQYRFSDGCGVMGSRIAELAQEAMGLESTPGSIQVRIGGVKGMLSLKEEFPRDKVGIRPSVSSLGENRRLFE